MSDLRSAITAVINTTPIDSTAKAAINQVLSQGIVNSSVLQSVISSLNLPADIQSLLNNVLGQFGGASSGNFKDALNKAIANISNVTFNGDSSLRGQSGSPSGHIYIKRDGSTISMGVGAGLLKVVLEGGDARWHGATHDDVAQPYYTTAQKAMASEIMSHLKKMKADIDVDRLSEFFH